MAVCTPSFGFGCVDEVLFNGGLDCERRLNTIKFAQLVGCIEVICLRDRNTELYSALIGVSLVPSPFHAIPTWGWHSEDAGKLSTATGKSGHVLVASWIKHPSVKFKAIAKIQ